MEKRIKISRKVQGGERVYTVKTIIDLHPWYPETRAKEILGLLNDEE